MILRESALVFAEKGFDGASIRDVSAATGVSVSGLYYYFKSKDELLFLIQHHCFETILHRLREDLSGVDDPEERLRVLVGNHLRFFADNMAEMKVLSHEADVLPDDYRSRVTDQKREYSETVGAALEALVPEAEGVDLRVATFSLFGMMNWIYTWYRPGKDVPVDRLTEQMMHIFLHGLQLPIRASDGQTAVAEPTSIWRNS